MKHRKESARRRIVARAIGARLAWAVLAGTGALAATPGVGSAQDMMLPKSLPDLVAEAEWITSADLVAAHARMNARGNLIVTDYTFRVVENVYGMPPDREFVLTQGGGTLNGMTDAISDTPDLEVGGRYLVFVRPGRGEIFAPFVGGAQGVYRLFADGRAMSLGGDRRMLDGDGLLTEVRDLGLRRGTEPPRAAPAGNAREAYPAKTYLPIALTPPRADAGVAPVPQPERAGPVVDGDVATQEHLPVAPLAASAQPSPDYHYEHRIAPPAVINGFLHSWSWHPEEEYQMSKWNQYGGEVFRVYTDPTGDWAWGNDRFDLAGWPSNDDMIAQFGEGWGANTLGITYSRWFGDGPIVEADTAMNPAYCWTLDERAGLDADNSCWGFRQTMLHELGHSWGLKHPWEFQDVWWDSVMNYSPKNFRFAQLFTDDANAVRAAFSGPAIHDALLSMYTTADGAGNDAAYTAAQTTNAYVRHGDNLTAWISNPFKIENLGTDDVVSPTVQFFLSQQRLDWNSGYVYLGSGTYSSVPTFTTYTYLFPTLTIPSTTPTGVYWLGAYLPDVDSNMNNNSAWADEDVTVHVANVPTTLYPSSAWQTSEVGYLGPTGSWSFLFAATAGASYTFSLCPGTGGTADFDSTITVSSGGTALASNDDYCDLQSELVFTAPASATYTVTVGSYHDEYQGSFLLAYRRDIVDPIFGGGFDP